MSRLGLLCHPKKPESLALAERLQAYLCERGYTVWTGSAWDEPEALAHVAELDVLITLGGDGTMLRAARIGSEMGVPILGVKLGKVSFLAEVTPDDWRGPVRPDAGGRLLARGAHAARCARVRGPASRP